MVKVENFREAGRSRKQGLGQGHERGVYAGEQTNTERGRDSGYCKSAKSRLDDLTTGGRKRRRVGKKKEVTVRTVHNENERNTTTRVIGSWGKTPAHKTHNMNVN